MTRDTRRVVVAECQACTWRDDAPGAQGRAAQHHDRHGHYVRVLIEVHYGSRAGATPGQQALDVPQTPREGALFA